ncbi:MULTISPECIES: hypothetical protein [Klebsiella/Raoultella group]|jgi:hypothetical protein|uniref:DUF4942 domain-containing protein n=1 Tax=Klebsiella huaxiensis TaxID=2153354 RepID=A0ABT6ELZ4_9ENTR|nr:MULTISPECIES: hypothetical protein [Klebsiella/Raoultella group]HBY9439963.1 hypothetical protein [Klebsiella pneumoniae]HCL6650500.1 hypothetical protein [Raoultella ornithinolytica]MDG1646405.1 hypothetical protein [Klebsiella huaxiensis]MDV1909070.1 hypothetical protein [Klebsiella pasteurii]MDV1914849.1 hypothetical protein [Klebsiella pasteurii]
MPTKHIDDNTAAQLDDLYVRCVTLTQQPVKEVEVLRLAILNGIGNITDNDILASMSVKPTVWEKQADNIWAEVTQGWPAAGIHTRNFVEKAELYSPLWRTFTNDVCREAIRKSLEPRLREHLFNDLFGFSTAFTEEENEREAQENMEKEKEYKALLPNLKGKLYSALSPQEQEVALYYSDHEQLVSFTPDGKGDFTVCLAEPGDHD